MTRICWIVWCGGMLLAFTWGIVHAASNYDTRSPGAAQPVLPNKDTGRSEAPPLPTTGETEHFRYAQEGGGLYRITPADGTPSYLVSENFLRVTLADPRLDSSRQTEILQSYPALVQEMFTNTIAQAYPDATTESAEPFTTLTLDGTDGTSVLLEQDPATAPYVRVRLSSGAGGEVAEFSVARGIVDQLLANTQLPDNEVIRGLRDFPFRLPEAARRGNFERLSAAELAALVQQEPALQQHEVIRMSRLYGKDAGPAVYSTETFQQKKLQAKQFREATSRAAESLGVRRRTALSQQPSHTPTIDKAGEQPLSNVEAMVHDTDELSPQKAASPGRFPVAPPATPPTDAASIGVPLWVLYVLAGFFFAVGTLVLVASLAHRKEVRVRR